MEACAPAGGSEQSERGGCFIQPSRRRQVTAKALTAATKPAMAIRKMKSMKHSPHGLGDMLNARQEELKALIKGG